MAGADFLKVSLLNHARRSFRWWWDHFQKAAPAWLLSALAGDRRIILLSLEEGDEVFARLHAHAEAGEALATLHATSEQPVAAQWQSLAGTLPCVLSCPADKVMERVIWLPGEAASDLDNAIRFGLSSWTPFTADEIWWAAGVIEHKSSQTAVRLSIVPRASLTEPIQLMQAAGFTVSHVQLRARQKPIAVKSQQRFKRTSVIDLTLAVSAAALLMSVMGIALVKSENAAVAAEERLRVAIDHTKRENELRSQISAAKERQARTERQQQGRFAGSNLLAEIGNLLPATDQVQELSWSGERGRIMIRSPGDPAIALGDSKLFSVSQVDLRGADATEGNLYSIDFLMKAAQ